MPSSAEARQAWRLQSPNNRGVIVDRLPDSAIPLGTTTVPPAGEELPGSYVPLVDWKTRSQILDVARSGERPGLIARTLFNGAPLNGVRVTLHTADGRILLQGTTDAKNLPGSVTTGEGEVAIRGAHVADIVRAALGTLRGRATVPAGADPLVINLVLDSFPFFVRTTPVGLDQLSIAVTQPARSQRPMVSMLIDGEAELSTVATTFDKQRSVHTAAIIPVSGDHASVLLVTGFDDAGRPAVLQTRMRSSRLLVDEERTVRSANAELEIVLPPGALVLPAQIVVEDAADVPPPELGRGDRVLLTPQRVISSRGEGLRKPARIFLRAPSAMLSSAGTSRASRLELLRFEEKGGWRPLDARVHPDPPTAGAAIDRLGVFALVRRR